MPAEVLLSFCRIISFGPWGFISAVPLVLSESYIVCCSKFSVSMAENWTQIFQTLSKAFILDDAATEVFDQVLLNRGLNDLVSQGREVKTTGSGKKFGKVLMSPLAKFSPSA